MLQILYCLGSPAHGPPTGFLVMQVRDLTDAPPPQVREHTDQPLHVAHSFLKCSCLRVRAGRTDESSLLGPHAEIQEGLCGEDRHTGRTSSRTKVRAWQRVSFLVWTEDIVDPVVEWAPVTLHSRSGAVWILCHDELSRLGRAVHPICRLRRHTDFKDSDTIHVPASAGGFFLRCFFSRHSEGSLVSFTLSQLKCLSIQTAASHFPKHMTSVTSKA